MTSLADRLLPVLESGLPETEEQARLLCVQLSQRADALREHGAASFPSTHVAQVDKQRHGGGVIGRTPLTDERGNALPRLTLSLR